MRCARFMADIVLSSSRPRGCRGHGSLCRRQQTRRDLRTSRHRTARFAASRDRQVPRRPCRHGRRSLVYTPSMLLQHAFGASRVRQVPIPEALPVYKLSAGSFDRPIGNWDTSQVTNMDDMLHFNAFNQPAGANLK